MTAAVILTDAAAIVAGARNETHGEKERSFAVIARFWSVYLAGRSNGPACDVSARDVAQMMVLLKIARSEQGIPVRDHFLDEAGYAAIAGELAAGEGKARRPFKAVTAAMLQAHFGNRHLWVHDDETQKRFDAETARLSAIDASTPEPDYP